MSGLAFHKIRHIREDEPSAVLACMCVSQKKAMWGMWAMAFHKTRHIREDEPRAVPGCIYVYCKLGLGSSEADQKTVVQSPL